MSHLRRGLTLVELVVAIGIVAVLLGLLLPAVQSVRAQAARMQCCNNLKQLVLAVDMYHGQYGAIPPARIEDSWATWAVLVLPYIDQDAGYRGWDLSRRYYEQSDAARLVRVPVFYCPARRSPGPFSLPSADSRRLTPVFPHVPGELSDYGVCGGSGNGDNEGADTKGAFVRAFAELTATRNDPACRVRSWRGCVTYAGITDGLSNTLFIGDKHARPNRLRSSLEDSSIFNGDHTYGYVRYAGRQADTGFTRPLAKSREESGRAAQRFGSWHRGVCNFAFGDGSVRAIPVGIDIGVLTRLADRADGLAVGEY